ncbi:MAG: cofactor-independent phosphoglycerate mutase [Bacillota bacterium]
MKYLVLLGDGMADRPVKELQDSTPLERAKKPHIDALAQKAVQYGTVQTVPKGFKPGSDVANLSAMGYRPEEYYSGRSPLEALSIGIKMADSDVAIRCNLVTIAADTMVDYSAGEITTAESNELISSVAAALNDSVVQFYAGVSYRHCLIVKNGTLATDLTPPHDITGRKIAEYMPKGEGAEQYMALMAKAKAILSTHPVNLKRIAEGKNPATDVWFWGAGSKPKLDSFKSKYGVSGAVISAVDLLKGIAIGAEMQAPDVMGATGTIHTNYKGKVQAVIDCYKSGVEYVYLHVEAPDECGHQGDICGKVSAIEMLDTMLAGILEYLVNCGEDYVIAVLPDHYTPLCIRTHSSEPVPYLVYKSFNEGVGIPTYTEKNVACGVALNEGVDIIKIMLER